MQKKEKKKKHIFSRWILFSLLLTDSVVLPSPPPLKSLIANSICPIFRQVFKILTTPSDNILAIQLTHFFTFSHYMHYFSLHTESTQHQNYVSFLSYLQQCARNGNLMSKTLNTVHKPITLITAAHCLHRQQILIEP